MGSGKPIPAPLIADPHRQAPDLHRGIDYQIWRSVEAWIQLEEGQVLFLEGAEDFDILDTEAATAVQVKATSGRLTLRSKAIITSLHNYWLTKEANSKTVLLYRFITTSEPAVEDGAPFGEGKKGLDQWTNCAKTRDIEQANDIHRFLTKDKSIQQHLQELESETKLNQRTKLSVFLSSATPLQVLKEVICPISFETGSGDADVVRESVAMQLRAHGNRIGVPPADCDRALDHLYQVVVKTAKQREKRFLSKDTFLQEFQQATFITLSRFQFSSLTSQMASPPQVSPTGVTSMGPIIYSSASYVTIGIPSLPPNAVHRDDLVQGLLQELTKHGTLLIRGSSGMGKSTLARILAARIGGKWLWVDFKGLELHHVQQVLDNFTTLFINTPTKLYLTLDNLDFSSSDLLRIDSKLAATVHLVRGRCGCVIITSTSEITHRLRDNMSLHTENDFRIPPFNTKEVDQFCKQMECMDSTLSHAWTEIILAETQGHPVLVHSRLLGLRERSWPDPTVEDLKQPSDEVLEELDIARNYLDKLPSECREFLYRLSLLIIRFRRDHTIAIADIDPKLDYPGDIFDRLVGPWIEPAGDEYFHLSPLLQKAAERTWSPNKILTLRANIARTLISCDRPTLLEASEMLLQGILASEKSVVTTVAGHLNTAAIGNNRIIADGIPWLAFLARQNGQKAFEKDDFANILLRLLQFRVISVKDPASAEQICEIVDLELNEISGEQGDSCRLYWMTHVLMNREAHIGAKRLLRYWLGVKSLSTKSLRLHKLISESVQVKTSVSSSDPSQSLNLMVLMIIAREYTAIGVLEFFQEVESLPLEDRRIVIEHLRSLIHPLRYVVSQVLTHTADSPASDWTKATSCLESIKDLANKWEFPDLAVLAYRTLSAIDDEYCDNPTQALQTLSMADGMRSQLGYLIQDQRASVLFRQKRYEEVIEIGYQIIQEWPVDNLLPDQQPLHACNRSGAAAGCLSRWQEAQAFFERGMEFADRINSPIYEIAFRADLAQVMWKLGNRSGALRNLATSLEELSQEEGENQDSLQFHWVWKSIELVISWFLCDSGGLLGESVAEPFPGFCSLPREGDGILEYPRCNLDHLWLLLARVEYQSHAGREVFRKAITQTQKSRFAAVRMEMTYLRLCVAFEDGNFSEIPCIAAALSKTVAESKAQQGLGNHVYLPDLPVTVPDQDPTPLIEESIIYSITALWAEGRPLDSYFTCLKTQIKQHLNGLSLYHEVELTESLLNSPNDDYYKICNCNDRKWLERMTAAFMMSISPESSLDQSYYGQVFLFYSLKGGYFDLLLGRWFAKLVKTTWERRCTFPSEFSSPRVIVPPILEACRSSKSGFALAALILLEARAAVHVPVPDEVLAKLRQCSQG